MKKRVLSLFIICFFAGCFSGSGMDEANPLVGVWQTSQKPYEETSWELKEDGWIIFRNTNKHMDVHHVNRIESCAEGNRTKFTIHYGDETTGEFVLSVYYFTIDDERVVTFKNQDNVVWTKAQQ